eukprot:2487353-Pleurochrysis_carterae.AAC.3
MASSTAVTFRSRERVKAELRLRPCRRHCATRQVCAADLADSAILVATEERRAPRRLRGQAPGRGARCGWRRLQRNTIGGRLRGCEMGIALNNFCRDTARAGAITTEAWRADGSAMIDQCGAQRRKA